MDLLKEATEILCEGTSDRYEDVHLILEDAESPITKKTIENLYKSIIDKKHIDFDDIPKSGGNIFKYSGFKTMNDTLADLKLLANENAAYADILKYVNIVKSAIENLNTYSKFYVQAFAKKNELLMLEYNTFVFTCVEATTSILYQFSDYMQTPSSHTLSVMLRNTKYRADLFYVDQLRMFNRVCMSGKYQKYLMGLLEAGVTPDGKNGVVSESALLVGSLTLISTILLSIVPITRRVIYSIQNLRGKIAEDLELQAYFLEMNKTVVKADRTKNPEQKKVILAKQEKLRLKFLRLAEKLRVKSVRAEQLAKKSLKTDDSTLTIDSTRKQVDSEDDGDFTIL